MGLLIGATVLLLWILPVFLGIAACKRKGISPHWMWFGIHPFSGWIAFFVIRFAIEPRRQCPRCKESIKKAALICHYCSLDLPAGTEA